MVFLVVFCAHESHVVPVNFLCRPSRYFCCPYRGRIYGKNLHKILFPITISVIYFNPLYFVSP